MHSHTKHKKIPKHPISFLLYSSKPFKKWAILAILAVTLASSIGSSVSYIFKKIVDNVTNIDPTSPEIGIVLFWVLMFPIAETIAALMWRTSGFTGSRWATGVEAFGYKKLFSYLSKHSQNFFDNRFAGSLSGNISIATNSTESLIETFLWNYLSTFINIVITFVYISTVSLKLSFSLIIFVIFLAFINIFLVRFRQKAAEEETKIHTELKGKTVDVATNMVAVKQFATRQYEIFGINKIVDQYRKVALKGWTISELILTANVVLVYGFVFIATIVIYNFWRIQSITAGDFVLIFSLLSGITYQLIFVGMSMNRFSQSLGQIKESLDDILNEHEIVDIPNAGTLKVEEGDIMVDNLTFKYHSNENIFENLSLNIKSNEKVGIVGPSGSGKTTFVKLLLRQYDIDGGAIYIDGQNIASVTQDSLHQSIAIVPQEPILFHRTIKENIAYGQDGIADEEIIKAAKKAEAHEFIEKLPKGYDTLVGERGVKLSAGQRQRIAIARAILKNSPILILDEATSALDSESEVLIQKALKTLMKNKTVIAIAHRLSTISEMDRIIVIKGGEITEDGSHNELIKRDGLYSKLWNHQAGGFIIE